MKFGTWVLITTQNSAMKVFGKRFFQAAKCQNQSFRSNHKSLDLEVSRSRIWYLGYY